MNDQVDLFNLALGGEDEIELLTFRDDYIRIVPKGSEVLVYTNSNQLFPVLLEGGSEELAQRLREKSGDSPRTGLQTAKYTAEIFYISGLLVLILNGVPFL